MSNRSIYLGIVAGLAGIGIWLWRVSITTPETPPDSPPEVAEMLAPAAPQENPPPLAAVEVVPAPPPVVADPQLDVHTAVADIAALLRVGDFANFIARYLPPGMINQIGPDGLLQMAQTMTRANTPGPREYQDTQQMIQALEASKTTEPSLNDTGDQAAFPPSASGGSSRIRMIKVDGRWYLQNF